LHGTKSEFESIQSVCAERRRISFGLLPEYNGIEGLTKKETRHNSLSIRTWRAKLTNAGYLLDCAIILFPNPPSPAKASGRTTNSAEGFAQAENRYPPPVTAGRLFQALPFARRARILEALPHAPRE
jgi:hypothetical protein